MNDRVVDDGPESGGKGPFWTRRRIQAGVALLVLLAVGSLLATSRGCRPPSRIAKGTVRDPEKEAAHRDQRFDAAWDALQRPEVFDGMFAADDEIGQDIDRLNQWLEAQKPLADWQVDPLAAPLAKSLASLVELVKPVDAAIAGPRDVLELKDIARHFMAPAAQLQALAQRRSLAELDQLARHYDESLKQIEDIARKAGDSLREARESNRDPTGMAGQGGGSGDTDAQLSLFEARFLKEFARRVRDPAKQATFKQLYATARPLDWPGRLRDPASLAALAQALEDLAAKHDRKEIDELVKQYEEVVRVYGESFNKTRLSVELRFLADEMGDLARMKDLAQWKALERIVSEVVERLKIAARRTNRVELRELALRVEEARNKRDIAALKAEAEKLAELVRPERSDDLKEPARQLADRVKLLAQLAEQLRRLAEERQSNALQSLAKYVAQLSANVQMAAKLLQEPPPEADPQKSDAFLDEFTVRYAVLGARVSRLAEDLDYFATLGRLGFPTADCNSVREAILLRDVSRWARGEEADDVSRAKRLFDWTVRNIQLEPEAADPLIPMKRPWETLILGTGTAVQRAWLFVLLARQQGLDAVVLALEDAGGTPTPQGSDGKPAPQASGGKPVSKGPLRPWAVAVLSEKDLYLFDPYLGLPIPGPGAAKLDESGQLDVRPATLAQVLDNPRLLREMDLDPSRPYWVQAAHLKRVVALLDGSPPYLAERMRVVESRLSADDRVVLSAAPTAQAERIKACRGIAEVRLWSLPYETWFQRVQLGDERIRQFGSALQRVSSGALWKGRVRHLERKFVGESSAAQFYGRARLLDRDIEALGPAARTPAGGTATPGAQVDPAAAAGPSLQDIARRAKQDAGYWLGLMAYEQGQSDPRKYAMAGDYLGKGTLDAYPDGPWTSGAHYNLGRVYEAQKKYPEAVQQYRGTAGSAESYGDQLRARWLEKLAGAELPGLPVLPVEKAPVKKEAPAKKEPPAKGEPKKEVPKSAPPTKEKPATADLPALPGLPAAKEPAKPEPAKKEPLSKEPPKPSPPATKKPELPDLPKLPGLQ